MPTEATGKICYYIICPNDILLLIVFILLVMPYMHSVEEHTTFPSSQKTLSIVIMWYCLQVYTMDTLVTCYSS